MLKLQNISKFFPGVKALSNVSLDILPGEVHAICGENGAGKSTLMNIIAGNILPDEGVLYWNDLKLSSLTRKQARQLGIGIVYQERSLVDSLSIAENIFTEQQPRTKWGLTDRKALMNKAKLLLNELGLPGLDPQTLVYRLSAGQQQMVEIAKAIAQTPKLLLLDEPTASITENEKQILFDVIRRLKTQGVSIIYISHRMAEIRVIADRISVLKDGTYQGTVLPGNVDDAAIIKMMIGRELSRVDRIFTSGKETVLQVKNLSGKKFSNASLEIFNGEIFGIAGLIGSGRTELARAIVGADKLKSGNIRLNNEVYKPNHPKDAIRKGVVYLSEDRKSLSIFPSMSVKDNMNVSSMQVSPDGFTKDSVGEKLFDEYREKLGIKTRSAFQKIMFLSGGNQQKVLLARALAVKPKVLIADEPTQGIDAGAKFEIYKLVSQLASEGVSIIIISSELTELLHICDRIGVMRDGKLIKILNREEASEESIMQYAYAENKTTA